jgi:outer membrane lipoprotein-sorting protein
MKKLLLLCLLPASLFAQELSPEQTNDLVTKVTEKRRGIPMQAEFREEKRMALMQKPVIEEGTLAFLPPDKFRREVKGRSLTVCDGNTLWLYYPEFNEAEKYNLSSNRGLRETLGAMSSGFGLQEVAKNFGIKATKTDGGYQLALTPKNSALRKSVTQILVNLSSDLTVQKLEIQGAEGDRTITEFNNERRAKLSESDFQFTPPQGASVSEPLK